MGLTQDVQAFLIQRTARFSATYGRALYFTGTDLPRPTAIRIPTRHGRVRCEVYRPAESDAAAPAYVHLHGGAFLMRHPRMDDFFARIVCAEVGAVVVNVDYDVAPQRRFPVAQEQAHDVAAYVAQHPDLLRTDPDRVVVGGFSAGGNLAAAACLQARDLDSFRPAGQLLAVPSLDVAEDPASKTSPLRSPMISPELLALVRATYFKDVAQRSSPYASPLRAPDLQGLAPALVVTGEYDVLRGEAIAYADRLTSAGADVERHEVVGADHYFLDVGRPRARQTLDVMVDWLRRRTAS